MAGILIVAHTPIASAMLDFVDHIYGSIPDKIQAIDIPAHEDTKISAQRLKAAVDLVSDNQQILILTDILGATPANVAGKFALNNTENQIMVITGLNLSMLLRAVSHRHEPLEQIVEKSLQGGTQGVVKIRTSAKMTMD
jgi:PTS system ascorbate-specific IIA component